jgi:hypothetical protein
MNISPVQNRSVHQISERSSIPEVRPILYRMPSQQGVNIHNQLLLVPHQRQKSSTTLEVTST